MKIPEVPIDKRAKAELTILAFTQMLTTLSLANFIYFRPSSARIVGMAYTRTRIVLVPSS